MELLRVPEPRLTCYNNTNVGSLALKTHGAGDYRLCPPGLQRKQSQDGVCKEKTARQAAWRLLRFV